MLKVVGALISRDGRILACQRSKNGKFPLKWEFPGGKVNLHEPPEQALARELNEELGAAAKIGAVVFRTIHKYAEMPEPVELLFFRARLESQEIENRIFENVAWCTPAELAELDFLDADRELIRKLVSREIQI